MTNNNSEVKKDGREEFNEFPIPEYTPPDIVAKDIYNLLPEVIKTVLLISEGWLI